MTVEMKSSVCIIVKKQPSIKLIKVGIYLKNIGLKIPFKKII